MKIKLFIYNFVGVLCVGLAFAGVFLPLLPTTPFLLLALFCFAHSSSVRRQKVLDNRILGPYVRAYESGDMPVRVKVRTLLLLWVVCGVSGVWATDSLVVRIILCVVVIGVTIHILLIKKKVPKVDC